MKRIILALAIIGLFPLIGLSQYSIPPTTEGWSQHFNTPVVEDADGVTFACPGRRNGNYITSHDVFDFSGKTIKIKWKFDKTGGYQRCRIAIFGTTVHFNIPSYSSLISNEWYYSTLSIGDDKTYSFKTARNNYAGDGGAQVGSTVSGTYADDQWHNITNGVILFYWGDAGADTKLTIGETQVDVYQPKTTVVESLLDMEGGQVPAVLTTVGSWQVKDDGTGNNCLFVDGVHGNSLSISHPTAVAVRMDVKVEYLDAVRIELYTNEQISHAIMDYEYGTTSITPGWQSITIPLPQTTDGDISFRFRTQYYSHARELWIDNMEFLEFTEGPADIRLSANTIRKNSPVDTEVGDLSVWDFNEGDMHTLELVSGEGSTDNSFFRIENGKLILDQLPDYENKTQLSVRIKATDLSMQTLEEVFIVEYGHTPVITSNQELSANENLAAGESIGQVLWSDLNQSETPTFSITAGNDAGIFTIDEAVGEIKLASAVLDFETTESYAITVQVTDELYPELTSSETVLININNVNDNAPQGEDAEVTFDEGIAEGTVLHTWTPTDADGDLNELSFVLSSAPMSITSNGLDVVVDDAALFDYEDASEISVQGYLSDGMHNTLVTLTVNLNNLNDNSPVIASDMVGLFENPINGTVVYTLDYSDPDGNLNPLTFTPTLGHPAFDLVGDDIVVVDGSLLDYEVIQTISLKGTISDGTYSSEGEIAIFLSDLNDNAPTHDPISISVDENSGDNIELFTISPSDPDEMTMYSFWLSGGDADAFGLLDDKIIVENGSLLDFETTESYSLTLTIDDGEHETNVDVYIDVNNLDDDAPSIIAQPLSVEECEGNEISFALEAAGHGTLTYNWLKDGVSLGLPSHADATIEQSDVDVNALYSCEITSEFGSITTDEVGIVINALPVVDLGEDQTITTNQSHMLDAGAGFVDYEWSDNSTEQTLDFSGAAYGTGVHTVEVYVIDENGCDGYDAVDITVMLATNLNEVSSNEIDIYPVPASTELNVDVSKLGAADIKIFNTVGQLVLSVEDAQGIEKIDVSELVKGYYLVKISVNDKFYTKKVLIL
ncbi:T9SS type A sorting domain-containing protein [Labilibacter sediminis]|nr:T9SS type A sorting domain-containing protein [Labilibacter sediminis]